MATTPNAKQLAERLTRTRANSFALGEVLTELMRKFGGAEAFAACFHEQFLKTPAGGTARARLLGDVLRLVTLHTENLKGRDGSLQSMTREELEAVLAASLEKHRAPQEGHAGGSGGDPAAGPPAA